MKFIQTCAATLLLIACATLPARADPKGIWLTAEGDAKIRIANCGDKLCGFIAWLKQPFDPDTGKPSLDKQNPDASKRMRALIGIAILAGMAPIGANQWAGPIYNADDGNTYDGKMSLIDSTTLKVEGCAFGVCQGENWSRSN